DRPLRSRGTSMGLSRELPGRSVCWARTHRTWLNTSEPVTPRTKPIISSEVRLPIACSGASWQHRGPSCAPGTRPREVDRIKERVHHGRTQNRVKAAAAAQEENVQAQVQAGGRQGQPGEGTDPQKDPRPQPLVDRAAGRQEITSASF